MEKNIQNEVAWINNPILSKSKIKELLIMKLSTDSKKHLCSSFYKNLEVSFSNFSPTELKVLNKIKLIVQKSIASENFEFVKKTVFLRNQEKELKKINL